MRQGLRRPNAQTLERVERGFAESNARFDSNRGRFSRFGNEGFAREPSGEGRAGFGGFAHEGGDAYGEGSHGGGGHR